MQSVGMEFHSLSQNKAVISTLDVRVPIAYHMDMGLPKYPRQTSPTELGQTSPSERYRKREQGWLNVVGDLIMTIIPWR